MSITTRTGDDGTTGLMYNRRVTKCDPRIEACGSVDELNAAIGLARAHAASVSFVADNLLVAQRELVILMGELATATEDLERYVQDGFELVTPARTARLDQLVTDIEAQKVSLQGWATPGATVLAAALDLARATCRRAERRVYALRREGELRNHEIVVYLNRLSDALWLLARWVETQAA
jgi:cob(I)alamin adenosyltransferase